MFRRCLAFAVALSAAAAGTPVSASAGGPSDEPRRASICRGERATLVGTPGTVLRGTRKRDVIVSNDAKQVVANAGSDLICLTGNETPFVTVYDGAGSDIIDSTAMVADDAPYVDVIIYLADGDDTVMGGPANEIVGFTGHGRDRVSLGDGVDTFDGGGGDDRSRDDLVNLGSGADIFTLRSPNANAATPFVNGGPGLDRFSLRLKASRRWTVDVPGRRVVAGADTLKARIAGFESFDLKGMRVPLMRFIGSDRAETVEMIATTTPGDEVPDLASERDVDLRTAGGADHVLLSSFDEGSLDAGAGDDLLTVVNATLGSTGVVDLAAGLFTSSPDRQPQGRVRIASVRDVDARDYAQLRLIGDSGDNVLGVYGCQLSAQVGGAAGDDTITLIEQRWGGSTACAADATPEGNLSGGSDDDTLVGGPGNDILEGGTGTDTADGRDGVDTCTAESVTACED